MSSTQKEPGITLKEAGSPQKIHEEQEREEDEDGPNWEKRINRFQLLNLVDGEEESIDVQSNEQNENDQDDSEIDVCENKNSKSSIKVDKRKNKRKKSKNKCKQIHQEEVCLNNNNKLLQSTSIARNHLSNEDLKNKISLLKFDQRDLVPENELTKIFGKNVVKNDHSNQMKLPRHYRISASSRFASIAENDIRVTFGVGPVMEEDEIFNETSKKPIDSFTDKKNKNKELSNQLNPIYFKFIHNRVYQIATLKYLHAVRTDSSEAIMELVSQQVNHVESLLQLSEMLSMSEDYKSASELVEKGLLVLENGFHSKFNLRSCLCRLTYKRQENRTFFVCVFKHIHYLARRGLKKTPLTYAKFLLSLDPDNDPLFACLLIDVFALRSGQYDYLCEFARKWPHASKFPNFLFSEALALFLKSNDLKERKMPYETILAEANSKLQNAMMKFPNFIVPLLDACSGDPSAKLRRCSYFDYSIYSSDVKPVPECIDLLVRLYVARTYMIWKHKENLEFLERNLSDLVEKFALDEIQDTKQNLNHWKLFEGPTPRQLLRHIVLSDLPSNLISLPASSQYGTFMSLDPFPPNDEIVSYIKEFENRHGGNGDSLVNMLQAVLRSFIPSFRQVNLEGMSVDDQLRNVRELAADMERIEEYMPSEMAEDEAAEISSLLSSLYNRMIGNGSRSRQGESHRDDDNRSGRRNNDNIDDID